MSTFTRFATTIRHGLSDMNYAQKRLFAHRTGVDVIDHGHVPGVAISAADIEARYGLGVRRPR